MPFIKTSKSKEPVELYYEDHGKGKPVLLIHGWPLSGKAWEPQVSKIVEAGFRCITYDRRGFGKSGASWDGYDYSNLAADVRELIIQLKLKEVTLVGFSMGGGEVVRYFTDYGSKEISKAALIASIIPLVKQKKDNPAGVPEKDLTGIMNALQTDRIGFLPQFHKNFYNATATKPGKPYLDYDFAIASHASPRATIKAAEAWAGTDFRPELKNVTVPTLIIHGDKDGIVPIKSSAAQAAKGIQHNEYHVIKGAPHGLTLTHTDKVNKLLIDFLKK